MESKLDLIKSKLKSDSVSLVAIRDNGSIYTDIGRGVKPIISPMRDNMLFFSDSYVGDKIIGKAGALLLSLSKTKYVYGVVMSRSAVEILKKYNINFEYESLVDYIENRNHDGMCPLEFCVRKCDDNQDAFDLIENKIKELMNANK